MLLGPDQCFPPQGSRHLFAVPIPVCSCSLVCLRFWKLLCKGIFLTGRPSPVRKELAASCQPETWELVKSSISLHCWRNEAKVIQMASQLKSLSPVRDPGTDCEPLAGCTLLTTEKTNLWSQGEQPVCLQGFRVAEAMEISRAGQAGLSQGPLSWLAIPFWPGPAESFSDFTGSWGKWERQ